MKVKASARGVTPGLPLAARLLWGCCGLLAVSPVDATSLLLLSYLVCCALDLFAVSITFSLRCTSVDARRSRVPSQLRVVPDMVRV